MALITVVSILHGAAELLIRRNYGVAMLVVTPLALLVISVANPTDSAIVVIARVFETFIGSLVRTIVALISARMRRERIAAN